MPSPKIARFSLLFAGLILAACASAPPEPVDPPAAQAQGITRLTCSATSDCSSRGGACRGSVCRADNECATDADCAAGSACLEDPNFGGLCADGEELLPAPLPAAPCSSVGLCPPGQRCEADGMCRPARGCRTDSDCRKGKVCDPATGRCTAPPPRCRRNADCASGQVCDAATGRCIPDPRCIRLPDGSCCDPTTGPCPTVSCTTDSDCPSGWHCRKSDPASPLQICTPR